MAVNSIIIINNLPTHRSKIINITDFMISFIMEFK